tara:strand:+ start:914 stop:1951 length:1038 start_codon:yes stop_codon:yes gene_type:complete
MLNVEAIEKQIEDGFISKRKHPSADLYVLNYTPKAQYDYHWTTETMLCRGLIVDKDYNIVERAFPKFFNYDEPSAEFPSESFEVWSKMDGSLGILYFVDNQSYLATRGSFESPQAIAGTKLLHKYLDDEDFDRLFDRSKTYLFEIICPESRVVVKYDSPGLVLLAIIDTQTGEETSLMQAGEVGSFFDTPKFYGENVSPEDLLKIDPKNKEGFVLRFESNHRLKIKFEEYKRLHSLVFNMTPRKIWSYLKDGIEVDNIFSVLPDELYEEVRQIKHDLTYSFITLRDSIMNEYEEYNLDCSRKEIAMQFLSSPYSSILFNMLDGKSCDQMIWDRIKPEVERYDQNN